MGKLINIDNGGTLTDICVIDDEKIYRVKTLTTPHDLSRCFFDGLVKASQAIYGREDLLSLLLSTDHIRYSTTQGTNALIERKGPRLGLILSGDLTLESVRRAGTGDLLEALVERRHDRLDTTLDDAAFEVAAVRAVNALTSAGANRVVIAHGGPDRAAVELRAKVTLLQKFPQHLLGAVPILYSNEVVEDENDVRRTWTALFNAFLHPSMERFLYNAEHKLRAGNAQSPLLIFRNDGHSARVAKTIAVKTYSSGPRGGMEGAKAIARHYGFKHLLTMDIGGTTTDFGEVDAGEIRALPRGHIQGVEISFPLSDVVSVGVGGSSIMNVDGREIRVGPQSVGSAPGPACFGLGGTEATMTDAFLASGLLDPASFFGGELKLDVERARGAIDERVAKPLALSVDAATEVMERAWVDKVARNLKEYATVQGDTVLAAFGGAGPLVVCKIAEAAGISRVLIPGLAAVFSAYGIGFSDIAHDYEAPLDEPTPAALAQVTAALTLRAERGMYAEGFTLDQCVVDRRLKVSVDGVDTSYPLTGNDLPTDLPRHGRRFVVVTARKSISQPHVTGRFGAGADAETTARRQVLVNGDPTSLPLYQVERLHAGATAVGPAVLEDPFFTCLIDRGWRFELNDSGDILLTRV
jgi:N-methylhydantoinase A/oxoprolinase/acetone carboxylase beta subunit